MLSQPVLYKKQCLLVTGLKELAMIDSEFNITFQDKKIYIQRGSIRKELYVYPSMWNENHPSIPKGSIRVSDKMLMKAFPKAYTVIIQNIRVGSETLE